MRTMPAAKDLLSAEQLRKARARSDLWGCYLVTHAWLTMFGAAALFLLWPNPLSFVLAVMVIGSRQLGLLILMHDAAHGSLCKSPRLNNFLGQYFCAFPTFADTFIYRRYHLHHHARTLRDDDPDIVLTGHYPISRASLRRKLWRDVSGRTGFSQRRVQFASAMGSKDDALTTRIARFVRTLGLQIGVNAVLFCVCAVAGYWWLYPALWLLPLLTWQQLVLRVRNIAEHAAVVDRENPFKNSRTTLANPLERLFVAPYWVNYHLEHHLVMWAPCYRLKQVRAYLRDNGFDVASLATKGYLAVLDDVTVDFAEDGGAVKSTRALGTFSDGFER